MALMTRDTLHNDTIATLPITIPTVVQVEAHCEQANDCPIKSPHTHDHCNSEVMRLHAARKNLEAPPQLGASVIQIFHSTCDGIPLALGFIGSAAIFAPEMGLHRIDAWLVSALEPAEKSSEPSL